MNTNTVVLLLFFLKYVLLFLEDNVDEECEQFLNSKVQPQIVAWNLLNFCQYQPGIVFKRAAYRKSVYIAYIEVKYTKSK